MRPTFIIYIFITVCIFEANAQSKLTTKTVTDTLEIAFNTAKHDTSKLAVVLAATKHHHSYMNEADRVLKIYNQALKIAERLKDKKSTARLLHSIGVTYMYGKSDEGKAYPFLQKALDIAEQAQYYEGCTISCYAIGIIYEHQGFRDKMYKNFFKAADYNDKSQNPIISPLFALHEAYIADNRLEDALAITKRLVKLVDDRNLSSRNKLFAYSFLFKVLKEIPDKKKEMQFYSPKILDLINTVDFEDNSEFLSTVSYICIDIQRPDLAIKFANKVLRLKANDDVTIGNKNDVYKVLSNAYEQKGNDKLSLRYYKIYSEEFLKRVKLRMNDELGRKIVKAEADRNLAIKQREIERHKSYTLFSIAIAVFIFLLGVAVFIFYRREQKRKAELSQLNATKDRLFAILSHDLQSPIANLQTYMNLIQWGALNQEEFAESTDAFSSQLGNVRTMLENVLNWSISQMGGIKPKFEICSIRNIIAQELELFSLSAKNKGIQIKNLLDEGISIRADKNHLAFIFRNLIQNAIKFSNLGGEIEINFVKEDDKVKISVADNGVGMSDETLNKLFKLEQTNSKIGTNAEKGTGLGLILTKEFVEANGGSMTVESREGIGTTFTLVFSLSNYDNDQ